MAKLCTKIYVFSRLSLFFALFGRINIYNLFFVHLKSMRISLWVGGSGMADG